MRVVLVSTTDITGGAARGTYRLHLGLRRIGIDSIMYVMYKAGSDDRTQKMSGTFKALANKAVTWLENEAFERACVSSLYCPWSMQVLPRFFVEDILSLKPDIVHLNGVKGFVPVSGLRKLRRPLVWTIVDMWAFTGGCHYSGVCEKFRTECRGCHFLKSDVAVDLANFVSRRKIKYFDGLNLRVAAISEWLKDCAKSSSILGKFPAELVHYGLDEEIYRPVDKDTAKSVLGLDKTIRYVAFGADGGTKNPRKGFGYTLDAMKILKARGVKNIGLLVFGEAAPGEPVDCPYPVRYMGMLNDDISMVLTYSSSDAMVVPSTQEGFGQTALEAMSCGTPVVTFSGIGTCDIVSHRDNGYVAKHGSPEDLANGIEWCMNQESGIAAKCRDVILSEYTLELQARRYEKIYKSLVPQSR
jgi:glycosyltransferase involved in cell wall biosynthesis